ncbi:Gfo/Idh/MocA family oxidoreductase [Streptosporangium sp. NPDC000239]|uniref:Gfo/Idh/MocA family protein n=1 Tax=unclassified Streptosporangium TaxID=2632669 RepID=UPI00331BFAF2
MSTRTGESRRWKLAIVGCGGAAFGIHLPLLTAHPAFEVVAVADREVSRAWEAARRFAVPHFAADATEVLDEADMLLVLTGVHEPLVELALKQGKHVFTEKPLSLDVTRTEELRRRALQAGLLLEVGAMRAYDPSLHTLLETISAGKINGGVLIKADGADQTTRADFLPAGFTPYTFDADPAPLLPSGLDGHRARVLQVLLWQGYHQLTALTVICPKLTALACVTTPGVGTLHALIHGGGAVFTMIITGASAGIYRDEIYLDVGDRTETLTFAPPYLAGLSGSGERQAHRVFASMWGGIDVRLRRAHGLPVLGAEPSWQRTDSAELAERVERLALELAVLASVSNCVERRLIV